MSPTMDVARFHAEYDRHPDDRIRLFEAVAGFLDCGRVLYAGSYVDIAPSVFFDDVHYVDTDRRAGRFFAQEAEVRQLIEGKRRAVGGAAGAFNVTFEQADYQQPLGIADGSVDLLVSLYAGFISEWCTRYLAPGGMLLANNSHGDASRASLDRDYELAAVITSRDGAYQGSVDALEEYLIPKCGAQPTVDGLHASNRGIAYTKSPFAYLFRRTATT